MRKAEINRKTTETDVSVLLDLDGAGQSEISTGSGFFDHMLTLFSKHGRFDLTVRCAGDAEVDLHHSVEDIGIALGAAFQETLGDKRGIRRYGDIVLPMDEALVLCAADISGRGYCVMELPVQSEKIGEYDTELTAEFFEAFSRNAGITLHIKKLSGTNAHHTVEAAFKAFGRVLNQAVGIDNAFPEEIPSTKGVL